MSANTLKDYSDLMRRHMAARNIEMDKAVAAALTNPPSGPLFVNPFVDLPPSSTKWMAPVFRIEADGAWVQTGKYEPVYSNPARAAYEKQKKSQEEFLRAVCPEIKPRAFCKTLYRMTQAGVGIPVGSFICSSCEEVWRVRDLVKALEHDLDGLCIPVAVEYRSELARLFHSWCSENGFTTREKQL
jgi:hypothetical protein